VKEDPTEIHHVNITEPPAKPLPPPPVRATVPTPEPKKSWFNPWWLLLLLCCLPLCFLPFLCCKRIRKYVPGHIIKPNSTDAIGQKELVYKEDIKPERPPQKRATVKRVEEPQEDIEIEIERELAKKAIIEE
jgi:hypothetical protein